MTCLGSGQRSWWTYWLLRHILRLLSPLSAYILQFQTIWICSSLWQPKSQTNQKFDRPWSAALSSVSKHNFTSTHFIFPFAISYFDSHYNTYRSILSSSRLDSLADTPVSLARGISGLSCAIFSSASLLQHLLLTALFGIRLIFHSGFSPFQQIDPSCIVLFYRYLLPGSEVASSIVQFINSQLTPFQRPAPAFLSVLWSIFPNWDFHISFWPSRLLFAKAADHVFSFILAMLNSKFLCLSACSKDFCFLFGDRTICQDLHWNQSLDRFWVLIFFPLWAVDLDWRSTAGLEEDLTAYARPLMHALLLQSSSARPISSWNMSFSDSSRVQRLRGVGLSIAQPIVPEWPFVWQTLLFHLFVPSPWCASPAPCRHRRRNSSTAFYWANCRRLHEQLGLQRLFWSSSDYEPWAETLEVSIYYYWWSVLANQASPNGFFVALRRICRETVWTLLRHFYQQRARWVCFGCSCCPGCSFQGSCLSFRSMFQ